jgi:hypothetical protein
MAPRLDSEKFGYPTNCRAVLVLDKRTENLDIEGSAMSAIGPKRTSLAAPHMSAFGSKADMTVRGKSAFAVAIGGKADVPFCTAYVR